MPRKKRPAEEIHAGDRARGAIDQRIAKEKTKLIAQLKKNPALSIACQNVGIGRRTYYRWRQEDPAFAAESESAIRDAIALRNDFVESKLLVGIREGDMRAIQFWLRHHHPDYGAKVKIERQLTNASGLTPEQEQQIRRSLRLSGLDDSHLPPL
jgi:hypothetical protein